MKLNIANHLKYETMTMNCEIEQKEGYFISLKQFKPPSLSPQHLISCGLLIIYADGKPSLRLSS